MSSSPQITINCNSFPSTFIFILFIFEYLYDDSLCRGIAKYSIRDFNIDYWCRSETEGAIVILVNYWFVIASIDICAVVGLH